MEKVTDLRYKRTFFIGLGGAGAKTLRILKRKIEKTNNGSIPKQIKFLLIDTNSTDLSNYRDFDCSEKVCISVREPYQRWEHDHERGLKTHDYIPFDNIHSLQALERGAGQIRSNGHFAVIENQYSNKLLRILRERADEIEDIDVDGSRLERDPKIEVRLVFSIAGGTGSGAFLPIATLIRKAIRHCELTAYIYSATHYSKFVENSAKHAVMQNAYAALCELDYMMHFARDKRHDIIRFNFGPEPNQQIEQKNRPFEEVYYIDKHTSYPASDSVEFAYNELIRLQENTAEAMHISATNIISAHTGTVDNVRQKIMECQFDVGDKLAWVSGLGVAELFFNELDRTHPNVINACKQAINARIGKGILSKQDVERISSAFVAERYDESNGDKDGDPVLKRFGDKRTIENYCNEAVNDQIKDTKTSDTFKVKLKDITNNIEQIADTIVSEFENNLKELVVNLVDDCRNDKKDLVLTNVQNSEGFEVNIVLSLNDIISILEYISSKLKISSEKIGKELEDHEKVYKDADNNIKEEGNQPSPNIANTPNQNKKWWKFRGQQTQQPQQGSTPTNASDDEKIKGWQKEGVIARVLAERDVETKKVLERCQTYVDNRIKILNGWITVLNMAVTHIGTLHPTDCTKDSNKRNVNVVEVQMPEVKEGLKLSYADIEKISNDKDRGIHTSDQNIFDAICDLFFGKFGSLQAYLANGIEEIKKHAKDEHIKIKRTECQQSIDRLIDLSTPTMQVDRHGYGDRVKEDHFWYVMTDCPEETFADRRRETTKDKEDTKSIGALLKELIEQNTLDAKINLIHVDGWKHKALVYRVDSAVPAYFVEGVCESPENSYTLEGCYEELKKTKHNYTPFSHKTLQEKLDNGLCVLKPHDETVGEEALTHWVNYMILSQLSKESSEEKVNQSYIDVKKERNQLGVELLNTRGTYTVVSDVLGEHLTGEVVEPVKILLLGEGARIESFNIFARYCKTLIEENKEYAVLTDPIQNDEYEKMFILSPEEYMENVLVKHFGFSKEAINKLPEDNPDKELIRKEMSLLRRRKQNFEEEKASRDKKQDIFDSHNSTKDKE